MQRPSVTVVDYGVGNLLSVRRALEQCGAAVSLTDDADIILKSDRLVLPGVGAFGDCMAELSRRGLNEPIKQYAASGKPLLGICVGMQIILGEGEEFGRHKGLGLIPGKVVAIPKIDTHGRPHKIPHIGWTSLRHPQDRDKNCWNGTILNKIAQGACAYFIHSFTAQPASPLHRLADTDYNGCRISAAIIKDNVVGTQFHPEKSGAVGLIVLSTFLEL